ncbi:MAG: penicillin-binding protein 2 [Propionibacteriaceae bacterium]|jgi:cell division protein FtsI (penicillin-binding protein 3)|nr:penicillin-binding protein 2 [Propionibacteriaceae bacterium]
MTGSTAPRRRPARPGRPARAARRWLVPLGSPSRRLLICLVACAVATSFLAARAVQVQGLDAPANADVASLETFRDALVPATRGTITDRNGQLLASSEPAVNLVVDPQIIAGNGLEPDGMGLMERLKAEAGPGLIAGLLTYRLGGDFKHYLDQLSTFQDDDGQDIQYAILARHVRDYKYILVSQDLARLGYVGLQAEQAPVRLYPQGTLAANLLGYMVYDDQRAAGQYPWSGGGGLELLLDSDLSGVDGREVYDYSSHGRIPTGVTLVVEPQDGIDYQLTLDAELQYMVESRIQTAVEQHQARSGTGIVLDLETGQLVALATYPGFDPNALDQADETNLDNRALTQAYETGSVQKVLTMAALLDAGLVTPDTPVEVPGQIESGGVALRDDWAHGTLRLTATGVIAQSSNIGIALLARQMDKGQLSQYLASFGLGQPTGLDWPGESSGQLPGADMSDQTRDQIAFGQGLSVTAVQIAAAVAAVVNHGLYRSPVLIQQAWTADGQPYPVPEQETRQVISPEASAQLVAMMEAGVVVNHRGIDGYRVAGKTGTADRYNAACACYRGVVGSFVGLAPAENPKLLVYVMLDDPQNGQYGSEVAQPAAQDILRVALPRYGVTPSTTAAPDFVIEW